MKRKGTIASVVLMGALAITGCNKTVDSTSNEVNQEQENNQGGKFNPGGQSGQGFNPGGNQGNQVGPGGEMSGGGSASIPTNLSTQDLEAKLENRATEDDATIESVSSNTTVSEEYLEVVGEGETYKITAGGCYVLKGTFTKISIKTSEEVHLILNGVTITSSAKAIEASDMESNLTVTLVGENVIEASSSTKKVVDVLGTLAINGEGSLTINANQSLSGDEAKNVIGVDGELVVTDATIVINNSSKNAIAVYRLIGKDATITINGSSKDGIKAEMDDAVNEYTDEDGYVYLVNVNYTYTGEGDGIQADTYVLIYGGEYNIDTNATFVSYSDYQAYVNGTYTGTLDLSDVEIDDFKYKLNGSTYYRVAKDSVTNNKNGTYAMIQSNKGIKVGEIDYEVVETDSEGNETSSEQTIYDGDYAIVINGGEFNINSDDDAIHANSGDVIINGGTLNITTLDDGVSADYLLQITGGTVNITKSYEGLEGGQVEIEGGNITLVSSDDGVNAASDYVAAKDNHLLVSGGSLLVNAAGDGLDSNGTILISGGSVMVAGATSGGNGILDSGDGNVGGILVNGGTLVAYGGSDMLETPASNSSQVVIVYRGNSISSGSNVVVKDSNGNEVMNFTLVKNASALILSNDKLENGESYSIYVNGNSVGSVTAGTNNSFSGMNNQMGPGGMRERNQGGFNQIPPEMPQFGRDGSAVGLEK